jgi:hypothetical protein
MHTFIKIISILYLFTIPAHASAAYLTHNWSRSYGDEHWQFAFDVEADSLQNTYITGSFEGTVNFGITPLTSAGGEDIYLAKLSKPGHHLWSRSFGDSNGWQRPTSLAIDPAGNAIIAGMFLGSVDFGGGSLLSAGLLDMFVAKFDPDGNHLWSKRFGDAGDYQMAQGIAVDDSYNIYVAGHFEGTVNFGGGSLTSAGSRDMFIAKLDADGNHVWSYRFGDSNKQEAVDLAGDNNGNIAVIGNFLGSINFGGGPLTNGNLEDICVAKFDSSGNHIWSQSYGYLLEQTASGISFDGAGNVYIAGNFYNFIDFGGGLLTSAGYKDIFLAKFDPNGNHVWSRRFGNGSDYEHVRGIAADNNGDVVIVGEIWLTVDFGGGPLTSEGYIDIFVALFNPDGDHLQSRRFGDLNDLQQARCATIDHAGNIIAAGNFLGTVDFGGWPLENYDGLGTLTDIFVVKFKKFDPNPIPALSTAGCIALILLLISISVILVRRKPSTLMD